MSRPRKTTPKAKGKPKPQKTAEVLPGLVADWGGFELFVAEINKTAENVIVEHNVELTDRAGVKRRIDVVVRYKIGLVEHLVVCECKYWKTNVPREKVDAFAHTAAELNASRAIMFSAVGFQSGAIETAKANGISLFKVREPTPGEWGAPGRFIDIYLVVAFVSIGPIAMPGAFAVQPVSATNFNLDFRVGGDDETKTEGMIGSQRIILEDFLQERAHAAGRVILQQEAQKGLPFFPENGNRRVWKTSATFFQPQPLTLPSMPNVFVPCISFGVGLQICQTRIRTDRAASYTFVVAVEDCITKGVTGATRRIGEAITSQFHMLPKDIDPSDVLQNGSIITVWGRDLQPFAPFESLTEGVAIDEDSVSGSTA